MKLHFSDLLTKTKLAFENENAFVVYRKPQETVVNAQFQKTNELNVKINFEDAGFLFAPFDTEKESIFFPYADAEIIKSDFVEDILIKKNQFRLSNSNFDEKDDHIKIVQKALDKIKEGEFKKVVLSRKEVIQISNFDLINTYKSLLLKYPTAMVYCWYHPKVGLWMGATPELLCKVKNTHFSTMSLAGTQKVIEHEKVYWTEKEKVEQQLVTDYIVNELKLEVKNLKISNPTDVKAGHLWHIKTDIEGEISNKYSLKNIIQKLHPTPAVCGIPKEKTKEYILNNENYDRAFYTGYLGEVNVNQNSELYVNLRCMHVSKSVVNIYVGGGITHDSLTEKEWEETVAKANTMKNVFF